MDADLIDKMPWPKGTFLLAKKDLRTESDDLNVPQVLVVKERRVQHGVVVPVNSRLFSANAYIDPEPAAMVPPQTYIILTSFDGIEVHVLLDVVLEYADTPI